MHGKIYLRLKRMDDLNILKKSRLDLKALERLAARPTPFDGIDVSFWNDPYVSKHVLHAHLDPEDDEASRRPETIDASVEWMANQIRRDAGAESTPHLLDLGCGPGLYASRFALRGFAVTGIDLSEESIRYARKAARRAGLEVEYRCADYTGGWLEESDEERYDAAFVVYGGVSEIRPEDRVSLLKRTRRALRPGGLLFFDVVSRRYAERIGESEGWYVASKHGFWVSGRHLVLEQSFHYPERSAHLQRFIVIRGDGSVRVFALWRSYFSPDTVESLVESAGLALQTVYSDLRGSPFDPQSEWLGVVAVAP